jgi:hypothetical protein
LEVIGSRHPPAVATSDADLDPRPLRSIRRYAASSLLRASPPPQAARPSPRGSPVELHVSSPLGLPVLRSTSPAHMPTPLPRRDRMGATAAASPSDDGLPRITDGWVPNPLEVAAFTRRTIMVQHGIRSRVWAHRSNGDDTESREAAIARNVGRSEADHAMVAITFVRSAWPAGRLRRTPASSIMRGRLARNGPVSTRPNPRRSRSGNYGKVNRCVSSSSSSRS